LVKLKGRDFSQTLDEIPQSPEVFVLRELAVAGKIFIHDGDGAADVADFMRHSPNRQT